MLLALSHYRVRKQTRRRKATPFQLPIIPTVVLKVNSDSVTQYFT